MVIIILQRIFWFVNTFLRNFLQFRKIFLTLIYTFSFLRKTIRAADNKLPAIGQSPEPGAPVRRKEKYFPE